MGENGYGDEFAIQRAFKDYLLVGVLSLAIFKVFLTGRFYIERAFLSPFILLLVLASYKVFTLGDALGIDFFRFFYFGPLVYLFAVNFLKSEFLINRIICLLIGISLIVSFIGLYQYLFIDIQHNWSVAAGQKRISSTLFSPNALSWYLVGVNTIILSILFFKQVSLKYLFFVTFAINLIAIVLSGSRIGVIFTGISLVFHFFFVSNRMRLRLIRYFIFLLPVLFSVVLFTNVLESRAVSSLDDARTLIYNELWNRLNTLPIQEYLFGVDKVKLLLLKDLAVLDDSFVLSLLPVFGIVGFLLIIVCFYRIFSNSISKNKSILSISLVMFLLMSFVGNVLYIFPHSILFWFLAGLGKNLSTSQK